MSPLRKNSSLYTMTPAEAEITRAGVSNVDILTGYWYKKTGLPAWEFDHNFVGKGIWQKDYCTASQTFIVSRGGIGTGKTVCVAMTAGLWALTLPDFKMMNVALDLEQSSIMYSLFLEHIEDTPYKKLIVAAPSSPHPQINIGFIIDGIVMTGQMLFMSLGEKQDAKNILSWRGDMLNIDEAGRVPGLADIVGRLSTRMTGTTARGREYVGRISLMSNPEPENPELDQLFDLAASNMENGLAFEIDTADNKNVSEAQLKRMLERIPLEDQVLYTTGKKPVPKGAFFSKIAVQACASPEYSDIIRKNYEDGVPGYDMKSVPGLGVWSFQTPRLKHIDNLIDSPTKGVEVYNQYFIMGDPGNGNAPARNAPCICVFDTTYAPERFPLVAFWWGQGRGSIMPFVDKLNEWVEFYKPLIAGVDSTSTQKNMAELINQQWYGDNKKSIMGIRGMDFSGGRKVAYLTAHRLALESRRHSWPNFCLGIEAQHINYDLAKDTKSMAAKVPQDIVGTFAMGSYSIISYYGGAVKEDEPEESVLQQFIRIPGDRNDPLRFGNTTRSPR